MNDFQQIKRLLLPALKGLPIIGICVILALAIAYRINLYTNPMYESTIKIKLDDINQGASSAELYANFDLFSHTNKIATEVEMLKSKMLIEKVIDQLDFDISYFRVGRIRTQELYQNCPFTVAYDSSNSKTFDKLIQLSITSETEFLLRNETTETEVSGIFGQSVELNGVSLLIKKNLSFLSRDEGVDFIDDYQFRINSISYIINTIIGDNLDVLEVDKDVSVVRVSFKSEVAEKTAKFVNTLGETYVDDYIDSRTSAAGKTVDFIDEQLETISAELRASEIRLESYRIKNNIINTRQETETDLRKISQLKIQLSNLNMNQVALDSLHSYMSQNGDRFLELAPNFEAYNDLLSTELIKKIKFYQAEKKDLLLKYTTDDDKVKVIDEKIADVSSYIIESIRNSSKNIKIKRDEIEKAIEEANKVFIGLPTKEKEMVILNRDFTLNQKIFNFLTEKRTEASIAQAASISFHRIIQKAYTPTSPVSPNTTLILIVLGMLGLITGLSIVYLREFIGGKIRTKDELEKISGIPVAGVVKNSKKNTANVHDEFLSLATNLEMLSNLEKHQTVLITSTLAKEGKTFVTKNLANAYQALGWKVAVIDLNFRNSSLHQEYNLSNNAGIAEVILGSKKVTEVIQYNSEGLAVITAGKSDQNPMQLVSNSNLRDVIEELEQGFDLVLIDAPATVFALEAVKLMKLCNHVYYIVRANFTKSHFLLNADLIAKEYRVRNIKLLLNDVHQASNYNGNYTGSHFTYEASKLGFVNKMKHYIKYYL